VLDSGSLSRQMARMKSCGLEGRESHVTGFEVAMLDD